MVTSEELQKQLEEAIEKLGAAEKKYDDLISKVSGFNLISDEGFKKLSEATGIAESKLKGVVGEVKRVKGAIESFNLKEFLSSVNIDTMKNKFMDLGKEAKSAKGEFIDFMKKAAGEAENTQRVLTALGAIGLTKARENIMQKAGAVGEEYGVGFTETQKRLMEVERAALQAGVSLGQSFTTADQATGMFNQTLADTMGVTHELSDEVLKVRAGLAKAFAPDEMIRRLDSLTEASKLTKAAMDLTNTAMLVSSATGMDTANITKIMTETHLDLGTSLEDTAKIFGTIREAAKDSGLQYETVANSIHNARTSLRFFGSTVEAISPIFKTFSNSLKGVGKEGLTPDLLRDFVGGLEKMDFGTRALLSISTPGMAAGGLLGGGLRMEKALETGEGMGDIAKSITETMKRFGGQRILTREEAIKTPGAERDYIIQRQILGKLTGISDTGKQNEMMRILQDVDKHGLDAASDSEKALGELMAAGERVQESTTTDLKKAQVDTTRMIQTQGERLVTALAQMSRGLGLTGFTDKMSMIIDKFAITGDTSVDELEKIFKSLSTDQKDIVNTLENTDLEKATDVEKTTGKLKYVEEQMSSVDMMILFSKELNKGIKSAMTEGKWTAEMERKFEERGDTGQIGEEAKAAVRGKIENKIDALREKLAVVGGDREKIKLQSKLEGLTAALSNLEKITKTQPTGEEYIEMIKANSQRVDEVRAQAKLDRPGFDIPKYDVDINAIAKQKEKTEILPYSGGKITSDGAGGEKIITIKLEFPEQFKEWNKDFVISAMGEVVAVS